MTSATAAAKARPPSRTQHHRAVKSELIETAHPDWVNSMISGLHQDWTAVAGAEVFQTTAHGELPLSSWRRVVLEFFCVVEAFPRYMGVNLGKATFGQRDGDTLARDWLIGNIRTEALHAQWFIDWGVGMGLTPEQIIRHRPGPEVAALHEYLWSVSYRGSLAEALGAVNYAIEGTTGEWTRLVMPAFQSRFGEDRATLMWLAEHAEYDDAHPREALELVKLTEQGPADRARVRSRVQRSLELFRRGFEACHLLGTEDAAGGVGGRPPTVKGVGVEDAAGGVGGRSPTVKSRSVEDAAGGGGARGAR